MNKLEGIEFAGVAGFKHMGLQSGFKSKTWPMCTRVQAGSRAGRWSWTLKRAQERSRTGRWSWTLKRAQERSRTGRWSWTLKRDSQESSGEVKSREVELDSHCKLDNPLLQLFLNSCFTDIDCVTLQLLKQQLAKYTSSFTQWLTVSWVFAGWSMWMNYSCLSPSPFLPHR